ncbi:MAG: hypothetical protein GY838_04140 [bacterium]|nr:hypothetical protein [bacterium]
MSTALRRLALPAVLAGLVLVAAAGCGEKISIPEPSGLYSVSGYLLQGTYDLPNPRRVAVRSGVLYAIGGEGLSRRNLEFEERGGTVPLGDPTALCLEDSLVFVWDDDAERLHWYLARDLTPLGQAELPGNGRVTAMATSTAGIEQVPGAGTYLYMSVPDSGVIRRFAFHEYSGPEAHGILASSAGQGARFVHVAGGMAVDSDDSLLVCDADPDRNWVIRFNATPDVLDVATAPGEPDPLRGRAARFRAPACEPPAADEYVLGNAQGCDDAPWVPGPSDFEGHFDRALDVTVDGSGRIFVADTGNDRVQIFTPDGHFDFLFGKTNTSPGPVSIAVSDERYGAGENDVDYAAWVFLVIPGTDEVRRFISNEHYFRVTQQPPPAE